MPWIRKHLLLTCLSFCFICWTTAGQRGTEALKDAADGSIAPTGSPAWRGEDSSTETQTVNVEHLHCFPIGFGLRRGKACEVWTYMTTSWDTSVEHTEDKSEPTIVPCPDGGHLGVLREHAGAPQMAQVPSSWHGHTKDSLRVSRHSRQTMFGLVGPDTETSQREGHGTRSTGDGCPWHAPSRTVGAGKPYAGAKNAQRGSTDAREHARR